MPVIFSHEVDPTSIEPGDFRVVTKSGQVGEVICLTLAPADDPGELRTALLVGDYGEEDDQPAFVEIIGNILTHDKSANFKGQRIDVTPLEAGPTIVLAEVVPIEQWNLGFAGTKLRFGGGSGCPMNTKQIVRVTWSGGVTKPGGQPADDLERDLYVIKVVNENGSVSEVTPTALADLNDGDNNHKLCLDFPSQVLSISFAEGYLTDPRDDLNPATKILVEYGASKTLH
jgi:hypothetical protein